MTRSQFVKKIALAGLFPAIIFAINVIIMKGFGVDFYFRYLWIDNPLHFFGGSSIAVCGFLLLKAFPKEQALLNGFSKIFQAFLYLSMTALAAVLWEVYEFLHDLMYQTNYQVSIYDTMTDLLLGLAGGVFVVLFLVWKPSIRRSKNSAR